MAYCNCAMDVCTEMSIEEMRFWRFLRATEGYHNIKNKNHAKHPLQTNKKGVKRITTST